MREPAAWRTWTSLTLVTLVLLAGFQTLVLAPNSLVVDFDNPLLDPAAAHYQTAFRGNDLTRLYLPQQQRIAEALRRDRAIPSWDPSGFGGRPLLGNPQVCLWYPPVWIIWISNQPAAWSWLTLGHLLVGAWGTLRLARRIRVGEVGALLASIAFALNPYLIGQIQAGHVPHVWSACWFPWAFLCLERGYSGVRSAWLWLALVIAASALTGHPQEALLLTTTLVIGAGIAQFVTWRKPLQLESRPPRAGPLPGLAISLTLAVGLTAIAWLPQALAHPWTLRPSGISLSSTDSYTIKLPHLIQWLVPLAHGGPWNFHGPGNYWETQLGPGAIVFSLAACAVLFSRRALRSAVLACMALIVFAWLVAAGRRLGLYTALYTLVPGFSQFRVPARALFLTPAPLAILAGLGIDRLASALRSRPKLGISIERLTPTALAILAVTELTWLANTVVRVTPVKQVCSTDELDEVVRANIDDRSYRVRSAHPAFEQAHAHRLGVECTDLYDWFQVRHATELTETLYPLGSFPRLWTRFDPWGEELRRRTRQSVLDLMAVGLVLGRHPIESAHGQSAASQKFPTSRGALHLACNPSALPRAYVVPEAYAPGPKPNLLQLAWNDPRRSVLIDHDPLPATARRQSFTPAAYRAINPDQLTIEVRTDAPGLLVVADTWMPGWSATHNGQPVPILRGNLAHRVVVLPSAGAHQVVMRYQAPGFWPGVLITCCFATVWCAATSAEARRRHTQPWRLRSHHSAVSNAVKSSKKGQVSQILTSRWVS